MTGGYRGEDPWETALGRPWLSIVYKALPAGMNATWRGRRIIINSTLSQVARTCALMHELVHEERRIGWPFATAATMEKEEATVRMLAALRLVPLDELERLRSDREDIEPITGELVAAEFGVTTDVGHRACLALRNRDRERELAERAHRAA